MSYVQICHLLFHCHCIINLTNFSCNVSVFRSCIYPVSGFYHSCFSAYEQVNFMRFKFPIAVCIKVAVFHDVIPWNMLDTYHSFRRTCWIFILVEEQDFPKCWYLTANLTASLSARPWSYMYFTRSTHKIYQSFLVQEFVYYYYFYKSEVLAFIKTLIP